jgi:hypothetical protein
VDQGDWLEQHLGLIEALSSPSMRVLPLVVEDHGTFTKALNLAARRAFENGAEYIARVNDDTEFVSGRWTSLAVAELQGMSPANVGVVGPTFTQGNTGILTHDFVHRSHLEIFDTYYPPQFDNWWVDDWITHVYAASGRMKKMASWTVVHAGTHGTRYDISISQHDMLWFLEDGGVKKVDTFTGGKALNRCQALQSELSVVLGKIWKIRPVAERMEWRRLSCDVLLGFGSGSEVTLSPQDRSEEARLAPALCAEIKSIRSIKIRKSWGLTPAREQTEWRRLLCNTILSRGGGGTD